MTALAPDVVVGPTRFDGRRAEVSVTVGERTHDLSFAAHQPFRAPVNWGDVWLPIAVFPAMRLGRRLRLADPVSVTLRSNVRRAQGLLATWFPEFSVVGIEAPPPRRRPARARRTAQTYTGGVDSAFTLVSNPEVSTLVYGHDLVNDTPATRTRISAHLQAAAASLHKDLVEVDMDVRRMLDEYGEWGSQTHGAVLAGLGAMFSRRVSDFLVPSSHPYSYTSPWGSAPILDHLWSGDQLRVVHDGAEATRFEKLAALDSTALAFLRVCWKTTSEINCSRCEKCLRTMTSLEILGRLDQAMCFHGPLDVESLREIEILNESDRSFTIENIEAAIQAGRFDISSALESALAASERIPVRESASPAS